MKIAYLGPEGSYSHLAAETFLKTERASRKEKIPSDATNVSLSAISPKFSKRWKRGMRTLRPYPSKTVCRAACCKISIFCRRP